MSSRIFIIIRSRDMNNIIAFSVKKYFSDTFHTYCLKNYILIL